MANKKTVHNKKIKKRNKNIESIEQTTDSEN